MAALDQISLYTKRNETMLDQISNARSALFRRLLGPPGQNGELDDIPLDRRCRDMKHVGGPAPPSPMYKDGGALFCCLRWAQETACLGQAREICDWAERTRAPCRVYFVVTHEEGLEELIQITKGQYTILYDPTMNMTRNFAVHGIHKELYGYRDSEWWGGMPTKGMILMSLKSMISYFYSAVTFPGPFFRWFQVCLREGIMPWAVASVSTVGGSRFMNVGGTLMVNKSGKEVLRMQEWAMGVVPTDEDLDEAAKKL